MALTAARFASSKRLQDASENKPVIKYGEKSDGVAILQQAFLDLGYEMPVSTSKGPPDGIYGNETYQCVKKFQQDQKFWSSEIDGVIGKDTLMILDDIFSAATTDKARKNLSLNLGYSMQAVNYVLKNVQVRAPNWDKYRGEPSWEAGTGPKDSLDTALYDEIRPAVKREADKGIKSMIDYYRIVVNQVKKKKAGNCGENSIVAFMFLYDLGVRPIDRMSFDDETDHAFVVIGRIPGDANDYANWGPAAVVCDSWAQGFWKGDKSVGSYPAKEFEFKMKQLVGDWQSVGSDHREG